MPFTCRKKVHGDLAGVILLTEDQHNSRDNSTADEHCHNDKNCESNTPKASPKKRSIIEYSARLPQDTKSLTGCSETEWRCFSNVIFETNVTSNVSRSSDSFSPVSPIVINLMGMTGDALCVTWWLSSVFYLHSIKFPQFQQTSH